MDEKGLQIAWTKEEVKRLLETGGVDYQKIDLPYGLSTTGKDRSSTCNKILPKDMTGKTVLDIGCMHGYFCFEALKRGARKAVGVDIDPEAIRKARLLSDCLGLPAEFHLLNIDQEMPEDAFDYVLCLNVLHHLKNPLSVLEKLIELTKERMILEVASIGWHDRRKLGLSVLQGLVLNRSPVMVVGKYQPTKRGALQTFYISRSAIENLLLRHRKVFANLDIFDSDFKHRYVAVAKRRKIKKLLVVAGPTSAGKSTFIEKLLHEEATEIIQKAGLENISSWEVVNAKRVAELKRPEIENLILHYDFLRPFKTKIKNYPNDEALDLLHAADEALILTLWVEPGQLSKQFGEGEMKRDRKRDKVTRKIWKDYGNPGRVLEYYKNWFAFSRTLPARHLVISLTDEPEVFTLEQWEDLFCKGAVERKEIENDERL